MIKNRCKYTILCHISHCLIASSPTYVFPKFKIYQQIHARIDNKLSIIFKIIIRFTIIEVHSFLILNWFTSQIIS